MKKTMYRITLMPESNQTCADMAILAARSNGREEKLSLESIKGFFESEKLRWPSLNDNSQCELIGDHLIHVDRKVGEDYKTVLIIEQIEIVELATRDNVVLQRYHLDNEQLLN